MQSDPSIATLRNHSLARVFKLKYLLCFVAISLLVALLLGKPDPVSRSHELIFGLTSNEVRSIMGFPHSVSTERDKMHPASDLWWFTQRRFNWKRLTRFQNTF